MTDESFTVAIDVDSTDLDQALKDLEQRAKSFGSAMTNALKSAIMNGKSLEDTLRGLAMSLAGKALDAGLQPLQNILTGLGKQLFGGLAGIMPFAAGGIASTGAFSGAGGVIAAPTFFPHGNRMGLMGEAGAEAILPLQRMANARLGVAAGGGGGSQVVVNITTPDVAGFERSQSQISAALARAVARGQRGL